MCLVTPENDSCATVCNPKCEVVYECRVQEADCFSPLLRQSYLCAENRFVYFYCRQMVTDFLTFPQHPHNFVWPVPSSTVTEYVMKLLQAHLG
jgi:hypothetical protein